METGMKNFLIIKMELQRVNWFFFSFALLLFINISPAQSDVKANVTLTNNYLWRGVTQTDDDPAISAGVEYQSEKQIYLGAWTSNVSYGDRPSAEVNAYVGKILGTSTANIDIGARYYYFPTGTKYTYDFDPIKWDDKESGSFAEISIYATVDEWNLGFSYSDNYLNSGFSGQYMELNYTFQIADDLSIKLHIGTQAGAAIDDTPEQTFSDHSITIEWENIYLIASDLDDNVDGRQSDNARFVVGWTKNF